jgi:hypothetical protein
MHAETLKKLKMIESLTSGALRKREKGSSEKAKNEENKLFESYWTVLDRRRLMPLQLLQYRQRTPE